MSLYAPSPVVARAGSLACLVLCRPKIAAASGAVASTEYWDFTAGVFDAPYDKAKHLKPCSRVGVDANDPDFTLQFASVPVDALADHKTMAAIYTVGADGDRADLVKVLDPASLRAQVGCDD